MVNRDNPYFRQVALIIDLLPFDNISDLPAVKWKLRNLAAMSPRKREESIKRLAQVLETL